MTERVLFMMAFKEGGIVKSFIGGIKKVHFSL